MDKNNQKAWACLQERMRRDGERSRNGNEPSEAEAKEEERDIEGRPLLFKKIGKDLTKMGKKVRPQAKNMHRVNSIEMESERKNHLTMNKCRKQES